MIDSDPCERAGSEVNFFRTVWEDRSRGWRERMSQWYSKVFTLGTFVRMSLCAEPWSHGLLFSALTFVPVYSVGMYEAGNPLKYSFELLHPPSMLSDKIDVLGRLTKHSIPSFRVSEVSQRPSASGSVPRQQYYLTQRVRTQEASDSDLIHRGKGAPWI